MESQSEYISKGPCPECDSSDACALYTDGHKYCFSCGAYIAADGEAVMAPKGAKRAKGLVRDIDIRPMPKRKLTQETLTKFGYGYGEYKGRPCHVANYYDDSGRIVAQKLRFQNKDFLTLGEIKDARMFGAQLWPSTGRMIVVTEGEIDCMSMSQAQQNAWPTVSIAGGAGPQVRKYIAKHADYLRNFETVVLMFDMDEKGQEAARSAADVIGPQARIAELPLKDANEMLKAGRVKELINAMWRAKVHRPEGIVSLGELRDEVMKQAEMGLTWPFGELTELTYGIRTGEIYAFGAGTGIGKTDFFAETIRYLVEHHRERVGVFSLEQQPAETARRILGKFIGKPIHIPTCEYETDELAEAFDQFKESVYFYDSFGINSWEAIQSKIRYLAFAEDVKYFFLDHLTALAASEDDERRALDRIMAEMGGLVKQLDCTIFLVSHLATPQGTPHEEGGRVMIRHFRGSRAIGFWCHYIFGLERNQQDDNPRMRKVTTFRVLKDRYTGRATGSTFYFSYDQETGRLFECEAPELQDPGSFGFSSEESAPTEQEIEAGADI